MVRYCLNCTKAVDDKDAIQEKGQPACPICGHILRYVGRETATLSSSDIFAEYDDRYHQETPLDSYIGVGHIEPIHDPDLHRLECEELLRYNPKNVRALYQLGRVYQSRFQWPQAKEQFQILIGIEPDHIEARMRLAEICLAEKRFGDAILHLDRVLHQIPEDPTLHFNYGVAHYFSGRLEQAARHIRLASSLSEDPDFKVQMSGILSQLEQS